MSNIMTPWDLHYLFIPYNEVGVKELEQGIVKDENVLTLNLNNEEVKSLFPVFRLFNELFSIMIAYAEEEVISNENLSTAIEIVTTFLEKREEPFATAIRKLMKSLLIAKEKGTYIEIDL